MESTRKLDPRSTSCGIEHELSKSAVHVVERSPPHVMSSTSHLSDQRSAETEIILEWMRDHPQKFVFDAIMELMSMALRRFGQFKLATVNHPEDVSGLEEQEKRFRLFMDGDADLDQRLSEAETVKGLFVSNLEALVRELDKAIMLFAPEQRQTLLEETDKVLGKAPEYALSHGKRLARASPDITPKVLEAIQDKIKSKISILYSLVPTSRHLGKILDEPEVRQVEEVSSKKSRPHVPNKLKKGARHFLEQWPWSKMPSTASSSTSNCAEKGRGPRSKRSESHSKQSSCSDNSPSDPSLFSDNGTHGRVRPSTNATTSTSLSKVGQSSNSIRASTGSEKSSPSISKAEKTVEPKVACGQHTQVSAERLVSIKCENGQPDREKLMLIDTGASDNYIRRSVVDELGLTIVPSCPKVSTGLDGHKIKSHGYVEPEWHFLDRLRPKEHPKVRFEIIDRIPNSFDILLGRVSAHRMGIRLCEYGSGVCVAHQDPENTVAQKRRQQQRMSQNHDIIEYENEIRQKFEAEHAELIEKRKAAAKASNHTKPATSTSHNDVYDRRDVRG